MSNIKSFRSFTEDRVKELVTTFGRFEPPTIGHGKLLDKVAELAKGKTYRIYASQSEDSKQNPLGYEDKIKFIRKMFPSYGRNILLDHKIKNILNIASQAYDDGFSKFTLVVGSDRIIEFKKLLNKYHGIKAAHGYYEFEDGITVKSGGDRDPDTEDITGMSSSKMRAAAADNDIETFIKGLPVEFTDKKELFNAVRKGMGLKESDKSTRSVKLNNTTQQREHYISGELFKIGSKVYSEKVKDKYLTIVERHSNFVVCTNDNNIKTKLFIHDICEYIDPIEVVNMINCKDGDSTEYIFSDDTRIRKDNRIISLGKI